MFLKKIYFPIAAECTIHLFWIDIISVIHYAWMLRFVAKCLSVKLSKTTTATTDLLFTLMYMLLIHSSYIGHSTYNLGPLSDENSQWKINMSRLSPVTPSLVVVDRRINNSSISGCVSMFTAFWNTHIVTCHTCW
jgi:hypothetical protein